MRKLLAPMALLSLFSIFCSIRTPKVQITGEKTALENQILGTYNEIEEDVWMVASLRAADPNKEVEISEGKKRVLEAMQNRDFNRDDIAEFKRDGAIGEDNRGLLTLRPSDKLEDEDYKQLVEEILEEDNEDRMVIMRRVIEVNEEFTEDDLPAVREVFAKLNREKAKDGEWIQLPDEGWVRKGEE
jgi:hypothetical protein